MTPKPIKTVYVCRECGSLYTEHAPADEGTEICDCGSPLTIVAQNESGVVTLKQILSTTKDI